MCIDVDYLEVFNNFDHRQVSPEELLLLCACTFMLLCYLVLLVHYVTIEFDYSIHFIACPNLASMTLS